MERKLGMQSRPRSLLFDRGLSESDKQMRDHYLDVGLNPDNPNQALVGTSGMSVSFGRNTNRMMAAPFQSGGARTLAPEEMNAAVRGAVGDGSFLDDYNDPKWHNSVSAGQHRPMRNRGLINDEAMQGEAMRKAQYGFDPRATPEEQARQLQEGIGEERSRSSIVTGELRERMRRNQAGERGAMRISSGGTIRKGGRQYRSPMGGGPMFDETPVAAAVMTPEAFVNPSAGVRQTAKMPRAVEPIALDGGASFRSAQTASRAALVTAPAKPKQFAFRY